MASKLIHPDNWPEMSYIEICRMLALAAKERVLVLGLNSSSDFLNWNSNDNKRYDYATYLKYISYNLKETWSNTSWSGYFKEGLDIGTLATSSVMADILWTEADLLADIGDAEFFDFSTTKNNPPVLGKNICYRESPHLLQYYNIITRLKKPVINLYYADKYHEHGPKDNGVEAEGVEYKLSSNTSQSSRKYNLFKEGIGTTGINGNPADVPYYNWLSGGKTDHDADYALGYVFPTNEGTSKEDDHVTELELGGFGRTVLSGFRAKAVDNFDPPTNPKAYQSCTYERVKCEFDYNFNAGHLNNVNGKPQSLKWIAHSSSYAAGDFGNPYATDTLFYFDQPLTNGIADDIYLGDNTNRPAAPDLADDGYHGFTFEFWLTIVEDWDYLGGFDYFTP